MSCAGRGYCQPCGSSQPPGGWCSPGATFAVRKTGPGNKNPQPPSGGLITCQCKLGAGNTTLSYLTP